MVEVVIIIGVFIVAAVVSLSTKSGEPKRTNTPPPKKVRRKDPPGWGTPHGY